MKQDLRKQELRRKIFEKIGANINKTGHHITVVAGGPEPRFAYSIGLIRSLGFELILAGATHYFMHELKDIFDCIVQKVKFSPPGENQLIECAASRVFSLRKVDSSWGGKMLLGAMDYLEMAEVRAMQIVPDTKHWTIDVPNMANRWGTDPVWQWLEKEWNYSVPKDSVAITNLDALRGQPITEVMRWEENEWEAFSGAGPDVKETEARTVPLGTLIAADKSLEVVTRLEPGKGLWRESGDDPWNDWAKS